MYSTNRTVFQMMCPANLLSLQMYFTNLTHLVMLHSGSMRWTRGSSMYSNCRLLSIRALSTFTETGTGPRPLDDGGETHTISFIDLLMEKQKRVKTEEMGMNYLERHAPYPMCGPWHIWLFSYFLCYRHTLLQCPSAPSFYLSRVRKGGFYRILENSFFWIFLESDSNQIVNTYSHNTCLLLW